MTRPIHSSQRNRPDFLDQSSPDKTTREPGSSPLPWYKVHSGESLAEDSDNREDDIDVLTAAASTPLHANDGKSVLFTSPLKKLHRLDLNKSSPKKSNGGKTFGSASLSNDIYDVKSGIMGSRPREQIDHQSDEDDDDDDDSDLSHDDIGNITFVDATNFNSTNEDSADDQRPSGSSLGSLEPPTYIRKRKLVESSAGTPITCESPSTENSSSHNVVDMSGVVGNETNESFLKISFSASDSTPCPPQPRKKLKLKSHLQDSTPSQPSRVNGPLLNLTSSRKLSVSNTPLLSKLNNATIDITDNNSSFNSTSSASKCSSKKIKVNSTPISQSTPANSRSNSPAYFTDESDEEINGYRFVKPNMKFKYETPQPRKYTQTPRGQHTGTRSALNEYNSSNFSGLPFGNYKIVGDFPVSAAGLMDEEGANIHIADKRIGDPYLYTSPSSSLEKDSHGLFVSYSRSQDKLPLAEHFKRNLDTEEMKSLVGDGVSVKSFYKQIVSSSECEMRTFLKKERLRWHPDKWESKLENSPFDETLIVHLSQVINGILEEL
ncbi:hypothetical protein JCM33374_g3443 [Metschnikowia sp. JCM 33374]|nr:hypothetical protein JCM33374_g3443 [Metschnikowia sp. JCM 33374]